MPNGFLRGSFWRGWNAARPSPWRPKLGQTRVWRQLSPTTFQQETPKCPRTVSSNPTFWVINWDVLHRIEHVLFNGMIALFVTFRYLGIRSMGSHLHSCPGSCKCSGWPVYEDFCHHVPSFCLVAAELAKGTCLGLSPQHWEFAGSSVLRSKPV